MDRNTGKDSAYRPLSDSPVAHTHHRETDPCYQGPRQVLARMPNLTTPDSPMDSTTRYGRSEHRGVGSGVSVKVLAGIAVGLVVVAVLGYLLVDQNKESDLAETPTWEPQVPAAEADAVPPWGSGLTASSPQASPESATQWNSPSPAPAWNTQVPGAPAGQPGDAPFGQPPTWQGEQNRVSSGPTELTATSAPPSETVWGQVNSPASSSPAPAADWGNPQQVGMWNNATSAQASAENSPSAQGPAWTQGPQTASAPNAAQGFVMPTTMPTPVATVDPNAPAADPNAAASYGTSSPSYESAASATGYAAPYPRQSGVARSTTAGSAASPTPSYEASVPASPTYQDATATVGNSSEPRIEPRIGYGADLRSSSQSPYPQAAANYPQTTATYPQSSANYPQTGATYPQRAGSYSQPAGSYPQAAEGSPQSSPSYSQSGTIYPYTAGSYPQSGANYPQTAATYPQSGTSYPQAATGPPTGDYRTADVRARYATDASMTTPSNSANTGSQPGYSMPAYSTGSQPGLQGGYPPANSGNYPAGGYPYGAPSGTSYPGNYPASGYPGASYGPSSAGGYAGSPSAGTNMAAGYNAAVSGNVPQVGAAQFQGSIEKPSNVQASYDSTRPSLY